MVTLFIFILILSILIMIHEVGHYVLAKKNGVCVEEFGLGIPPRIFGKKIGETMYSLNLLPFGGFVKLTGEDPEAVSEKDYKDPKNFLSKTPYQRISILIAGVVMNLVLGVFLYYTMFFLNGFRTLSIPLFFDYTFRFGNQENIHTVIMSVQDNSAATESKMDVGDAILEIDGVAVYSVADVRRAVGDKIGQEVEVMLMDLKEPSRPVRMVKAVPKLHEDGTRGVLGVFLSNSTALSYESVPEKLLSGPMHSYNMIAYSGFTLSKLVEVSIKERDIAPVSSSVSGPVGIYTVIGSILDFSGDKAYLGLLDLIALMSLSLAFVNFLPFPALDGGRIIIVLVEKIRGKRINPTHEASLHRLGMVVLLALMLLVTIKDVMRIFG